MKPPSNRRSKEYKKIIKQGCGGFQDPYHGDYDCRHQYDWNCEECPINRERKDTREPMPINPVIELQKMLEAPRTVTKPEHNKPQVMSGITHGVHQPYSQYVYIRKQDYKDQ